MEEKEKVGTPTGRVTQYGRPEYETPEGERVSEKSATLPIAGKFINVPSIHDGYRYNEDELMDMLKMGKIKPTSMHDTQEDAIKAAVQRSKEMVLTYGKAEGGIMMAQQGKAPLPMQEATSAPQGGGPKAANPAAMIQGLAAPKGPAPRPGAVDPRDEAVKEVSAKMQAKQTPPPSAAPQLITDQGAPALMQPPMPAQAPAMNPMMQPPMATPAAPPQEVPMMAKGGMPEDEDSKGLAVMIGLGAPTPSYEEAAEGNPPPGATKEEVADDQLVLLSEGELVVPANVVRYHGLGAYEGMRREALMGIQEMENSGQIEYVSGGKEKADPIDDNGGLVKAAQGTTLMGASPDPFKPRVGGPSVTFGPGIGQPGITPTAASQQFVKTPTTSGMMRQADTTPLVLDGKPYTPTTDLTSIYAPEQDYNAGGPEECQEGYQYNYVTQKCEKIPTPDPVPDTAPQQTRQQSGEPQSDDRDPDPYNIGGGRTVLGGTTYGIGYQSSDASAGYTGLIGGLAQGLLGKNDQVIFTDPDTGRTATMSRARYDQMKEDRNNPNTAAYINNLMDIQEGLDKDYRNQKGFGGRGSGFIDNVTSPGARNFDQNNAARALAQDMGMDYTGQSLAEMVVASNREGAPALSSSGGVDPASQTVPGDAQLSSPAPPSLGFDPARDAMFAGETGSVNFGQDTSDAAYQDVPFGRTAAEADSVNIDYIKDNIRFTDSIENQLAFLDAVIATGGAKDVDAGGFNRPATRNEAQNASFARAAANVRGQILEARRPTDYEAEAYGSISSQTDKAFGRPTDYESEAAEATRRAEAQRREDAQKYRPGTAYPEKEDRTVKQNKEIADAEAKQQMRDQGKDEDTVRRTSAVTDSKGNPVRQGGSGSGAGSVVTNTQPKEEKGGGGKVICTAMHQMAGFGSYRNTLWQAYAKKAYKNDNVQLGYHKLFATAAENMYNSPRLAKVLGYFARNRTVYIRNKMRNKPNSIGSTLLWTTVESGLYVLGAAISRGWIKARKL